MILILLFSKNWKVFVSIIVFLDYIKDFVLIYLIDQTFYMFDSRPCRRKAPIDMTFCRWDAAAEMEFLPSGDYVNTTVRIHRTDTEKTHWEKTRQELHKNCYGHIEKILKATPRRNNSCTSSYLPSLKPSKLDEQDMRDAAGEDRTNSSITFSYRLLHMNVPMLVDQQELTYNSSMWTQDVVLKTYLERWMIEMSLEICANSQTW